MYAKAQNCTLFELVHMLDVSRLIPRMCFDFNQCVALYLLYVFVVVFFYIFYCVQAKPISIDEKQITYRSVEPPREVHVKMVQSNIDTLEKVMNRTNPYVDDLFVISNLRSHHF